MATAKTVKENVKETIKELMTQYDAKKAEWVAQFNTDQGFDFWFTTQVTGCNYRWTCQA